MSTNDQDQRAIVVYKAPTSTAAKIGTFMGWQWRTKIAEMRGKPTQTFRESLRDPEK
jgi:hypothetical protein